MLVAMCYRYAASNTAVLLKTRDGEPRRLVKRLFLDKNVLSLSEYKYQVACLDQLPLPDFERDDL